MKTLTAAEIQILMRKAKTLQQSHELAVLLCQTLKAQNQGKQYFCYTSKGLSHA
jgi:hypothetical protein